MRDRSPDGRSVLSLLDIDGIDAALLANDASLGDGRDLSDARKITPTTIVPMVIGLSTHGFPSGQPMSWQPIMP